MKPIVTRGATSIITHIFVQDSASTTGGGKTGLTNSSAGLVIAYIRPGEATVTVYAQASANIETITTIGTYQAPTAGKIRFKEVDATNFPGLYEIHAADSVYNTTNSRRSVSFIAFGAAGMAPVPWERQLTGSDIDDGLRQGMTALPAAAAMSTGGLACLVAHGGTAQAGAATSITLAAGASATTDFYKYLEVSITGGTGQGQSRLITAYNGTTKVATVHLAWATNPDSTSLYEVRDIASPSFDSSLAALVSSGTGANQISLSSGLVTLAGVTHTGAVIPTVTTLTNAPPDEAGVTTLLSRLSAGRATNLDNLDTAISSRLAPTVGGRTLDVAATGEAGLDFDNIHDATLAHTLTNITVPTVTNLTNAPSDSSGTTTLLGRLTAGRATNLDNLDAAVTSRLAPTVAGRTLDVAATGEAGLDFNNINDAALAHTLTNITVPVVTTLTNAPADSSGTTTLLGRLTAGRATNLDNLDAAVSTRLATTSYTAPLDAAATKAQVVAALITDTYPEPAAVPAATASLKDKIGWMTVMSRNKLTGNSTTINVRNDGDSGNIGVSTDSDDNTTAIRGKFV